MAQVTAVSRHTTLAPQPLADQAFPASGLVGAPWPEWALRLHEAWLALRERLEVRLQALPGSATAFSHALCLQLSHWHCEWIKALPLSGPDLASAQALVARTRAWLHHEALIDDIDELLNQGLNDLTLILSTAPGLGPLASHGSALPPHCSRPNPSCSAPASAINPAAHTASTHPSHPDATTDG